MSPLPLPANLHKLVRARGGTNRSLVFDRSFDRYGGSWSIESGQKGEFLLAFVDSFGLPADYKPFVARRGKAMEAAGAVRTALFSHTRLVVGLGLPHPTETALLLDRLTGCPYLPGSSVKGVLRAAARLVAAGELETEEPGDLDFWQGSFERLFGPHLDGQATPSRGELLVHDAFPDDWPGLEVDVLTPHFGDYYGEEPENAATPPGDWHDPVPVSFLTVKAGTRFSFWLGHRKTEAREAELAATERLLVTALDWLGIGGKTSSGYGLFGREMPQLEPKRFDAAGEGGAGKERVEQAPPEPVKSRPAVQEVLWNGATLEIFEGKATVFRGKQKAQAKKGELGKKLEKRLKKKKKLKVDAWVVPRGNQAWRIAQVEEIEE